MTRYTPARRFHRLDAWRGYSIPSCAVAGASDTGMWSDSPCPSNGVKAEIRRFQREVLRPLGIKSRTRSGSSSNVFCGKRWVCVSPDDFQRAAEATQRWLDSPVYARYHYMHDADLEKVAHEE